MKRPLLKLFSILLLCGSSVYGQQVSNGGFETWGASSLSANDPTGWGTTNADAVLGPVSVTQGTAGAYEGSSYAIMTTSTGYGPLGAPDTLPGIVLHEGNLFMGGPLNSAYSYRPLSVMFSYQSNMVGSDTGGVYMELTENTNLVGAIWYPVAGSTLGWNTVNVPVYYFNSNTPDSMMFMGLSSAGIFQLANVLAEPGSEFMLDAVVICQQLNPSFTYNVSTFDVDFTETHTATGGQLSWDFGDGNNSTMSNPSHTYATDGTYTVSLTVTDSCGNDSTVVQSVTVIDDSGVESGISNSTFSVYPNPSENFFNVLLEMTEVREISVDLYDLSGRNVMNIFSGNTDYLNEMIDGSMLEGGTYILRISSSEGFIQEKITMLK